MSFPCPPFPLVREPHFRPVFGYPYGPPFWCPPYPPPTPLPPPNGVTTPAINGCKLEMFVQPSTVNLIRDFIPVQLGVFFNQITNMEVVSGTYTPANNAISLATGLTSNPNFIILITNNQANLTIRSGSTNLVLQNPVMKLYFNAMIANTTYSISDIILDGQTSAPVPMLQNIPVSYTLIWGTGIVN